MVMGFPRRHYFFFPSHALRVLCMRPQKTSDDRGVVIRQIEALDELINIAYKEILICHVDQWPKSFDLTCSKGGVIEGFLRPHAQYTRVVRRGKKIMVPGKPHNHMYLLGHVRFGLLHLLGQAQSKLWSDT